MPSCFLYLQHNYIYDLEVWTVVTIIMKVD